MRLCNGWETDSYALDGAWRNSDGKTGYDPCSDDFRVPTKGEWDNVLSSNEKEYVGNSWSTSGATIYKTGLKLGEVLFLPAAGIRYDSISGALDGQGHLGLYWSSSKSVSSGYAECLPFGSGYAGTGYRNRLRGFSVRYVAE